MSATQSKAAEDVAYLISSVLGVRDEIQKLDSKMNSPVPMLTQPN